MTIIKHGNPKERLHFGCPECGCEWKARVGETEQNALLLSLRMKCPDCGYITRAEECKFGDEAKSTKILGSFDDDEVIDDAQ